MSGLAVARIKYKANCVCMSCGASALSPLTRTVETGTIDADGLIDEVQKIVSGLWIEPPLGWAVYGRRNFKCGKCKT